MLHVLTNSVIVWGLVFIWVAFERFIMDNIIIDILG